ncbi:probable G-protein coupled receptor 141 [Alligator mississippiensis]|uniref:probable G-protein coupled receptor 141 n=1 Tax=Alligator mississippiensis TaxID=8496 RepID=UPI0009070E71|nr:probable G-protein coupled receptor 141 [Alligator mississippiensis]
MMEISNTSSAQQLISLNETQISKTLYSTLISLYSVDLAGGITGVVLMSRHLLQRRSQSVMTAIIINLMVVHAILLLSLPFRLSYYISSEWKLGRFTCRMISGLIYVHMYTTFIFYVAIILIRLLKLEFKKCYTTTWLAALWLVGTLVILPIFLSYYGTTDSYKDSECFQFQKDMMKEGMMITNYCLIATLMTIFSVLTIIQLAIIFQLAVKYWPEMNSHVEFRAHMKSFFFTLVILVCFIPHHVFRLYYIKHFYQDGEHKLLLYNEIFLAFTAMCCLDMLCFVAGIAH